MTARVLRALSLIALSTLAACGGSSSGSAGSAPAPAPAVAAPKPFEYTATSAQYRFTSESKGTQSMMGQSRETSTSAMRLMSVVVARATSDTLTVNLTIDSMTASNSMGVPTLGIDKLPGSKFAAKISPNGTFYSSTGPSESENKLAYDMTDEVVRSLPRLKAILASGAAWTDTIKDKVRQNGLDITRDAVTKFNVAGDTTVSGETGWKILRESTLKASGTGTINGQAVTIELTGSSKGVLVVGKRGVLLGGRGEESSSGTLMVTAMNLPVTITSNSTSQFTKVK
jgi:hypothetical protein